MSKLADRAVFAGRRQELMTLLAEGSSGLDWCGKFSDLADELVASVYEETARAEPASASVALLAVGGYGRRELAPFSDIDLIMVPSDDASRDLDAVVRRLHRELHAAIEEPRLSYAYFLINDAAALDPRTQTALLDARLVCGSELAFAAFMAAFRAGLGVGEFLLEKLHERTLAHQKWNDTPLAAEPNVKEGAGGLRSFHFANWVRDAMGFERKTPSDAYDQALALRNDLHLLGGTAVEAFTRTRQAAIAEFRMRDLDELVSSAAEARLFLHREYEDAALLIRKGEYPLAEGVKARDGTILVEIGASLADGIMGVAIGSRLGLEIPVGFERIEGEIDGPAALFAIGLGERTIRLLDRSGMLATLLPELVACRTLMPEDAIHAYSVFEHSVRTVRAIEAFSGDSFYGRLRDGLSDQSALILAALLHDAGKAVAGRPHSEVGAEIARNFGERWRLSSSVTANVEWLVQEHLTISRFLGMRDVSNPETSEELARLVGDRERLDMLTVLTCADVSSVAPEAWTPAQDAFLRELHSRTAAFLETKVEAAGDPALYRRRLLASLRDHPAPQHEIELFLDEMPAHYAVGTPAELVPLHMELVRKARAGENGVVWDHDRDRNLSEVTVCAPDEPGLLSCILGVLYAFELSVHGLRASTTTNSQGIVLDTVLVSFGHHAVPQATCALAVKALLEALGDRTSVDRLLAAHGKDPARRQDNFSFNFIEGRPGILEVQAPRGRGMGYRIAKMIAEQGWDIASARFGQWAGKGAAAFYIHGPGGRELTGDEVELGLGGKV